MGMEQIALNIGFFLATTFAIVLSLRAYHITELTEAENEHLKQDVETFKMFLKKLDVKLPTKSKVKKVERVAKPVKPKKLDTDA